MRNLGHLPIKYQANDDEMLQNKIKTKVDDNSRKKLKSFAGRQPTVRWGMRGRKSQWCHNPES